MNSQKDYIDGKRPPPKKQSQAADIVSDAQYIQAIFLYESAKVKFETKDIL